MSTFSLLNLFRYNKRKKLQEPKRENSLMSYKIVFFDVDGTLIDYKTDVYLQQPSAPSSNYKQTA